LIPNNTQFSYIHLFPFHFPNKYLVQSINETHTTLATFIQNKKTCQLFLYPFQTIENQFQFLENNVYHNSKPFQLFKIQNKIINYQTHLFNNIIDYENRFYKMYYNNTDFKKCKIIYDNSSLHNPITCLYTEKKMNPQYNQTLSVENMKLKSCYDYLFHYENYFYFPDL
jgi:hypothetical protein